MIYLNLFFEFLKIGIFAVGGGLATLPFLYSLSDKTGWFTYEQIADMIAISESTPGPIGINMATYVGYNTAGIAGGIAATLGLVVPALIIIITVARFLKKFKDNKYVAGAFYGLRPASLGLVCAAFVSVLTISVVHLGLFGETGNYIDLLDVKSFLLAAAVFFLIKKTKWHPALFLLLCAVAGVLFKF